MKRTTISIHEDVVTHLDELIDAYTCWYDFKVSRSQYVERLIKDQVARFNDQPTVLDKWPTKL